MFDQPKAVRKGEQLDEQKLSKYLRSIFPWVTGPLKLLQFPSGFSNLTYALNVGERNYVLRRPPFGANIKSGHDMGREFRILSGLYPVFSKVPEPIHFCQDPEIIGAPFYIMERVDGIIVRKSPPKQLSTASFFAKLSNSAASSLAEIHAVDVVKAGLNDLGKPEGYVQRQIEGWTRRYARAKTDEIALMDEIANWLAQNMPTEAGASLIHNDYKYDNFILDPRSYAINVILDWEMATIGCPLMDLGATLGYWLQPDDDRRLHLLPLCPTYLPGNLSRRGFAECYAAQTGRSLKHLLFYYVYGVWRIAVIIQQIYARFKAGVTQDQRFSILGVGVQLLAQQGAKAIDRGKV